METIGALNEVKLHEKQNTTDGEEEWMNGWKKRSTEQHIAYF